MKNKIISLILLFKEFLKRKFIIFLNFLFLKPAFDHNFLYYIKRVLMV